MSELLGPGQPCPVCREPLSGYRTDDAYSVRVLGFQRLSIPERIGPPVTEDRKRLLGDYGHADVVREVLARPSVSRYLEILDGVAKSDFPYRHLWNLLPEIPRSWVFCSRFWNLETRSLSLGLEPVPQVGVGPANPELYSYYITLFYNKAVDANKMVLSPLVDLARLEISRPFPEHP